MRLIVLYGKANCGKTAVLTKLYQKLFAFGGRKFYMPNNQDGDFSAVFEYNNHLIGITSNGDSKQELEKAFGVFEKFHYEILVVACRAKNDNGGSKQFVIEKAKQYGIEITWYKKAYIEAYNALYNCGQEKDRLNDIQANILLQEIN